MWKSGSCTSGAVLVRYWMKWFKNPSEYGILNGRISKLSVKIGDKTVAEYDRGWVLRPTDADAEYALDCILALYN